MKLAGEDAFLKLDTLRNAAGYKDLSLFFTDAVTAFGWMLEERAKGHRIAAVDSKGEVANILEMAHNPNKGGQSL